MKQLEKFIKIKTTPWRFWIIPAILGVSLVALSSIFIQIIFQPFSESFSNTQSFLSISEAFAKITMIFLGIIMIFIFAKWDKKEATWFTRKNFSKILIYWILSALIFNIFMYFWDLLVPEENIETTLKAMWFWKTIFWDIAFVVTITVLAPIWEEILFRIITFRSILSGLAKYKKIWLWFAFIISIIITSFLFANVHLAEWEAWYFMIPYFILALICTYVYISTKSIYTAIISHSINNTFVMFMALITLKNLHPTTNYIYGIVLLWPFLAFWISYLIEKIFSKKENLK